jgi:hypothetical protein
MRASASRGSGGEERTSGNSGGGGRGGVGGGGGGGGGGDGRPDPAPRLLAGEALVRAEGRAAVFPLPFPTKTILAGGSGGGGSARRRSGTSASTRHCLAGTTLLDHTPEWSTWCTQCCWMPSCSEWSTW